MMTHPSQVDLKSHTTASGVDFYTINPKGNVPCVVTKDGVVLNEGSATLQFIADQNPSSHLAPLNGTTQRYELINALSFISSELQANFGPLFRGLEGEAKEAQLKKLYTKLDYAEKYLVAGKKYIIGENFTVADSYLYIVLTWPAYIGVDISKYTELNRYFAGIKALDFIQAAHAKMASLPAAGAK